MPCAKGIVVSDILVTCGIITDAVGYKVTVARGICDRCFAAREYEKGTSASAMLRQICITSLKARLLRGNSERYLYHDPKPTMGKLVALIGMEGVKEWLAAK